MFKSDITVSLNIQDVINSLDTKKRYKIWHDGGEWFISLEGKEMTNCKTLVEWLSCTNLLTTNKTPDIKRYLILFENKQIIRENELSELRKQQHSEGLIKMIVDLKESNAISDKCEWQTII
ncbi:MAG: hypothetical protein WC387_04205 [Candidatus Paceibacterota bacterium]|jgi:hypothetical protein